MAFGRGERLGQEFPHGVGGEAGPGRKEIAVDGLGPCGDRGAEAGTMEKFDEVLFRGLRVGIVGLVDVCRMLVRESIISTGGVKVDVPEAGTFISLADDGGDAGDNGADVVLVKKDVVTTVVAELT